MVLSAKGTIWRNSVFLIVRCKGRFAVAMAHLLVRRESNPNDAKA